MAYFERAGLPLVIAVNAFHGRLVRDLAEIHWAFAVGDHVPVVAFDARESATVRDTLLALLDEALAHASRGSGSRLPAGHPDLPVLTWTVTPDHVH